MAEWLCTFENTLRVLSSETGISPRRPSDFLVRDKKVTKEARLPTAVRRNSLRAYGATLIQPPEIRRTSLRCATLARALWRVAFSLVHAGAQRWCFADLPQLCCETGLPPKA